MTRAAGLPQTVEGNQSINNRPQCYSSFQGLIWLQKLAHAYLQGSFDIVKAQEADQCVEAADQLFKSTFCAFQNLEGNHTLR